MKAARVGRVYLVGVRGIPNRYGGFERLVEVLAPYLVSQGYETHVFCAGNGPNDEWRGVHRHFIPASDSVLGTFAYDLAAFRRVPAGAVALIFGYGTAVYQTLLRARGIRHAVNMDGIEWRRAKWGGSARVWLRLGERAAARLSDVLIADHPAIREELRKRLAVESTMIPYGVDLTDINVVTASHPLLDDLAGEPFALAIARAEPENNLHMIIEGWTRAATPLPLVVVGDMAATAHGRELIAAYPAARFAGAIYDPVVLDTLRARSKMYLHGHSVGGTNPSLIEAMAAGALVFAQDNVYNRWVLGEGGRYFRDADGVADLMTHVPGGPERTNMLFHARQRCEAAFLWPVILTAYENVVEGLLATSSS